MTLVIETLKNLRVKYIKQHKNQMEMLSEFQSPDQLEDTTGFHTE